MRFFRRGSGDTGPERRTESYASFEARLKYNYTPGHRPSLVPDPGTEHDVGRERTPFDAVHAVVHSLGDRIENIPRATARKAAKQFSVYPPGKPTRCGTLAAALATVSRTIAGYLAYPHELCSRISPRLAFFSGSFAF
jgi:hypothetical protein